MADQFSVLVVTAEPDKRFSTGTLRRIVEELACRPRAEVNTFFLRADGSPADNWGASRVVDDLRNHPLSRLLEPVGARPTGWFKGLILRRWLAEIDPNVILLDDGLGERVVQSMSSRSLVVVRPNEELPASAELEPPPLREAALVLRAADADAESPESLESGHLVDARRLAAVATSARADARQRWSIPPGEPLLVGWGSDPWLDGTSLFIRTLWYLRHRYDTAAHGVWLGSSPVADGFAELEMEVERCGLTGRMHFEECDDEATRLAGDAVYLPHRTEPHAGQIVDVIAGGSAVVGFAPAVLDDPSLLTVSPLDLDAAAQTLATVLREDPQRRLDRTMRLDVGRWASSFIDAVDDLVARSG